MTQPSFEPAPQSSMPSQEPEDRLLWEAPRLTRFGTVGELTQGISYRLGDGISNLT